MNILDYILFNFSMKEIQIYKYRRLNQKTLEEVGKEFGVTRERIRQIENKIDDKVKILKLNIIISQENEE